MSKKSLGRLPELQDLYKRCIDAEDALNDNIFTSLQTLRPDIFIKKYSTHGYYIKHLLMGFTDVSSYEEISGDVNDDKIMSKVIASVSRNPQVLIDLGLGALAAEFKNNKDNGNISFAAGNLDEAKSFVSLKKMLESSFPGSSIKDTAPKDFGSSVLYDMQIEFPLDFTDRLAGSLNINIENKTGITNSAYTSSFHFGSVSSKAITGGDMTYASFLKKIQEISRNYLNGLSFNDGVEQIRELKDEFIRNLAIQYVEWRLDNNFPVFTSSKKDNVVLCSNIIEQMIKAEKLSLDESSEDPGDRMLKYFDSRRYKEYNTVFEDRQFKNIEKTGVDSIVKSLRYQPEALSSIEKLISQQKNISPEFKISLWYGK